MYRLAATAPTMGAVLYAVGHTAEIIRRAMQLGRVRVVGWLVLAVALVATIVFLVRSHLTLAGIVAAVTLALVGAVIVDLRKRIADLTRTTNLLAASVEDMRTEAAAAAAAQQVTQPPAPTSPAQGTKKPVALSRATRESLIRQIGWNTREQLRDLEAFAYLNAKVTPRALMPALGRWAINTRSMARLADLLAETRPHTVLELGGGASTIWMGYLVEGSGGRIVSVDHSAEFIEFTRADVTRHSLQETVETRHAPLAPLSTAPDSPDWYDTAAFADLSAVDLLVVDGPPGTTGPRARQPALPALWDRLAPGAHIVLDDMHRDEEKATVDEWSQRFNLTVIDPGTTGIAILRAP
ncbi:class I SAM-dependent methyltransferase [Nocardioides sp. AE5]|uniref:O-methyltransferase n=1 Tax=Nocardioides sp. AE5 TaxID=2962573 RepID=UPI0028819246|nr:class I SAM-dependent methyltransferase [Nocardioides sp. AE5]MDT0203978.1 class I SAM-dependent methyltransferase [Nocardioides sp. AE5]